MERGTAKNIRVESVSVKQQGSIRVYNLSVKNHPSYSVRGVLVHNCHYIKNLKAKRTKTLHEYVKKLLPGYLWAMSGTPIKNNIPEFWSILKIMAQCPTQTNGIRVTDEYHNYWEFVSYFCNEVKKKVGRATYRSYDGFKNQRVFKELLRQKMIRRTLADLQLSLPEEVNLIYPVAKLTQEERLKNAYTDYELSKTLPTSTPEKVQAALDKISYTVPVIKGLLEEGNAPVLVLSDYISVAEAIHREFEKEGSRLVTGNVPPPKRFALCEEFQRGTIPILICTIGSIKEGLTLTAANYAVFNDLCWVPSDLAQVKRRILRIGQTKTCFYYYISAPGIDENITKKLMEKAKILMQSLAISSDSSPYDILA